MSASLLVLPSEFKAIFKSLADEVVLDNFVPLNYTKRNKSSLGNLLLMLLVPSDSSCYACCMYAHCCITQFSNRCYFKSHHEHKCGAVDQCHHFQNPTEKWCSSGYVNESLQPKVVGNICNIQNSKGINI